MYYFICQDKDICIFHLQSLDRCYRCKKKEIKIRIKAAIESMLSKNKNKNTDFQ